MSAGGVETKLPRGGAVVARQAHNLEVAGSNPAPGIADFLIIQRLFFEVGIKGFRIYVLSSNTSLRTYFAEESSSGDSIDLGNVR